MGSRGKFKTSLSSASWTILSASKIHPASRARLTQIIAKADGETKKLTHSKRGSNGDRETTKLMAN